MEFASDSCWAAGLPGGSLRDVEQGSRGGSSESRRPEELWGKQSLAVREVRQVLFGNQLLLFSFHMMILRHGTGDCGALGHPAPPAKVDSASIWRTAIAELLCQGPGVQRVDFAQGLLGARSPKPTSVLTLNLPHLAERLWKGRVCDEIPQKPSIGKDSEARWLTSGLKEYPPAMCKALAASFADRIQHCPVDPSICISSDFMARCDQMIVKEYSLHIGPDYAG